MIEENAAALSNDPEDQALDTLEDEFTEEERRKLEWVGVRTVGQLREVERSGTGSEIGRVTNLPVERLRKALRRAAALSLATSQLPPILSAIPQAILRICIFISSRQASS